jgi:hypothetical protein
MIKRFQEWVNENTEPEKKETLNREWLMFKDYLTWE